MSQTPASAKTGNITVQWGAVDPDWDLQLAEYPNASIFHTTAWLSVLEKCYGFIPVYLSLVNPDGPPSQLLLMEVNSPLTGRRGVSLPFTDLCAPLCDAPGPMQLLFTEAIKLGKARRWKYLELRGGCSLLPDAKPSLQFYGHTVDLASGEQTLFSRLHPSVRQAIRKAEKSNLTVRPATGLGAVEAYYKLHCKTRRKHGLPPQPFSFFRAIHYEIIARDKGMVFLTMQNDRPVAGAIHFYFGRQAVYKFGASDPEFLGTRSNAFIMWEAIKWLRNRGFESLHLGRSSLGGEGLRRFKLHFGSTEHSIDYVRFDLGRNQFVTENDRAHGWHTRLFRILPAPLSRIAGQILYRHMA